MPRMNAYTVVANRALHSVYAVSPGDAVAHVVHVAMLNGARRVIVGGTTVGHYDGEDATASVLPGARERLAAAVKSGRIGTDHRDRFTHGLDLRVYIAPAAA